MAMRMTFSMVRVALTLMDAPAAQHYGYALRRQTGLASGVLHPILGRMTAAGWLEAADEPVADSDGDRPLRRYYTLTDEGRSELTEVLTKARTDRRFETLFSASEEESLR
ncbi:PadR family transcriptional regulator [Nocardia sp. 004]|uniref:PadR family transcriptional regulator n=1 Tax=Nocardia sp. 004 TaxID=3385978 RepID=UPI00399F4BE0